MCVGYSEMQTCFLNKAGAEVYTHACLEKPCPSRQGLGIHPCMPGDASVYALVCQQPTSRQMPQVLPYLMTISAGAAAGIPTTKGIGT